MQIEIPEEVLSGLRLEPGRARLDFAVGLYTEGGITLGRAARIAEMTQGDFRSELGRRGIVSRYEVEDLRNDLQTLASLREDRVKTEAFRTSEESEFRIE
jgi:predicted HTH domain antitoxin